MTLGVKLHRISPRDKADQAKLDVVFIHGLGGHWQASWQAKQGALSWPELLATDQPELDVWSLEYPAIPWHWRASKAQDQLSTADMVPRIAQCMKDAGIANSGGRPCVFVCHSLGGIVAKRLLLDAEEQAREQNSKESLDPAKVVGVLFLGTPHRGSAMADWLKTAETGKQLIASAAAKATEFIAALAGSAELARALVENVGNAVLATSTLIEELTAGNADLARLNERFITYWQERHRDGATLRVRICAETHKLHLIDQLVVDLDSADPNLRVTSTGVSLPIFKLPYDHMQICKVVDLDSEVSGYLRGLIQECMDEPEGVDLQLPPHRYQAVSAVGRLIASKREIQEALIDKLQLRPACSHREVRDKLMGQADMLAGAKAVDVLAACLRQEGHKLHLNTLDKIVSWAMVAGLVPDACSFAPNKIVAFAVPGDRFTPGTDVDAAILETALAQALRRIPKLPAPNAPSGTDFSPHLIAAGEVMARDIDPGRLLHYLERRVLDEVELGPSQALRDALDPEKVSQASALNPWDRGDLQSRVFGMGLDGRGIGLDDRVRESFMKNQDFYDALRNSPLQQVLFIIGAADKKPGDSELAQFRGALRQYLKDRQRVQPSKQP